MSNDIDVYDGGEVALLPVNELAVHDGGAMAPYSPSPPFNPDELAPPPVEINQLAPPQLPALHFNNRDEYEQTFQQAAAALPVGQPLEYHDVDGRLYFYEIIGETGTQVLARLSYSPRQPIFESPPVGGTTAAKDHLGTSICELPFSERDYKDINAINKKVHAETLETLKTIWGENVEANIEKALAFYRKELPKHYQRAFSYHRSKDSIYVPHTVQFYISMFEAAHGRWQPEVEISNSRNDIYIFKG